MDNKNINLTIDEIHGIRHENYENIKNMTDDEIIAKTKKSAAKGWAKIEELRKTKGITVKR